MDSPDERKQQLAQVKKRPSLSKRQRRAAGPNPSNTWQQQPRIKSAGARARAYISYAGLDDGGGDDNKRRRGETTHSATSPGGGGVVEGGKPPSSSSSSSSRPPASSSSSLRDSLDPHLDLDSPEVKFGRLLGGTDQRSRHAAVKLLRAYLRGRTDFANGGVGLSELDLLKLWKGLWYTLYMADKAPVQDKLSKILAELMWSVAGTEEEDEYAGEVYMQMQEDCGDPGEEDGGRGVGCVDDGVFEDADGDTMEIIEMSGNCSDDDDDDNEDAEGEDGEDQTNDSEDEEEELGEEQQRIRDMNEKHCRGAHLVSLYISTFLCTVRREWGNVDKHRVDKFYTAVRFMISEAYKYMSKRNWNIGIIRLFNDAIYNEGLSAETQGLTNGLRYHLIDICIDELAKVNRNAALPLTEATFLDCLEPFFGLAKMAEDKNVQRRVMQNVLLKFLNEYSFVSAAAASTEDGDVEGDDAETRKMSLIFNQVHVGTVSKFIFTIASDSDTDERYRKSLYEMHKTFTRQIRLAGRDVDIDVHDSEDDVEETTNEGNELYNVEEEVQDICQEEEPSEQKVTVVEGAAASHEEGNSEPTDVPSEKKKRRKKKKKAEKDASVKGDETATPETSATEETCLGVIAPETKSSSKKKTKKQHCEEDGGKEILTVVPQTKVNTDTRAKEYETAAPETPMATDEMCLDVATIETKSSSKKKKKKQHSDNDASDVVTGVPQTKMAAKKEDLTPNNFSTPESKSAKKKRKLQEDILSTAGKIPEDLVTTHVETPVVDSSKKKKKQKPSPPSVDPRSMHSPDQVINQNTSIEESGSSDDNDASSAPSKRVSFGKVNHCKSHKASMKAIKTLDKGRWDTTVRTPDKGILRPKIGIMSSVKKGQNKRSPLGQLPSSKKKGKGGHR